MRIPSGVTDQYIYFVAVDSTDLKTRETGLTTFTIYRSRNGAAAAAYTTATVNETDTTNMPGVYELLLDEDMTIGSGNDSEEVCLHITQASMAPVTRTFELYRPKITAGNTLGVESDGDCTKVNTLNGHTAQTGDTYALANGVTGFAAIDTVVDAVKVVTDNLPDSGALTTIDGIVDNILLDTAEIGTAGAGLTDLGGMSTGMKAEVNAECDTAVAALNDPTAAAIADAVWDEAQSGHVGAGTFGVTASEIASILVDTGTTLQAELDGIQADTEDLQTQIGTAGAGLTDLGGMSTTMKAQVNTEADAAFTSYDPPTNTEMVAAFTEIKGATWATTDSLEAIRDRGDAEWITGGGGSAADIADAVWDEAQSGHTGAGTFGEIATEIASVLADTSELQADDTPSAIAGLDTKLDTIDNFLDTEIAAIKAVTDALPDAGALTTIDGNVDAVLVDTAVIGALGAGLTGIPWNAAWDAQVQSECADALTAYDPATHTELVAEIDAVQTDISNLNDPTAAAIADQVWLETLADHSGSSGSTAEALNAAGAAGDPWATALPGAYGAGSAGKIIGDNINAPLDTIDTVVDAIKAVTDNLPNGGALTDLATSTALATVDLNVDAILVDTGTTIPAAIAAIDTQVDELHKLEGLDGANPVTTTPTSRVAGSITQVITGDGITTSTVTRP